MDVAVFFSTLYPICIFWFQFAFFLKILHYDLWTLKISSNIKAVDGNEKEKSTISCSFKFLFMHFCSDLILFPHDPVSLFLQPRVFATPHDFDSSDLHPVTLPPSAGVDSRTRSGWAQWSMPERSCHLLAFYLSKDWFVWKAAFPNLFKDNGLDVSPTGNQI